MSKLTDRDELSLADPTDFVHIVDVSDTTDNPEGSSKKIQVGNVGGLFLANSTVVVNTVSDFPAAIGGIITLAGNTNYVVGTSFSVGTDRFDVSAGNVTITGNSTLTPVLVYTGTGNMFSGADVNFSAFNLGVSCPSGTFVSIVDTIPGTSLVFIDGVNIGAATRVVELVDVRSVLIEDVIVVSSTQGFQFRGSNFNLLQMVGISIASPSPSFVAIDIVSSVATAIILRSMLLTGVTGSIGLLADTNNDNLQPGSIGIAANIHFLGDMQEISGVTTDDVRWRFEDNTGILPTTRKLLLSLNGNTTATVISAPNTPVKVAGTWVCEIQSFFDCDTTGTATFIGETPFDVEINFTTSTEAASGSNKDIRTYVAINGSIVANSGQTARVGSNDPRATSLLWRQVMEIGDTIEVFVENTVDTVNLVVVDAVMRLG